MKKTLTILSAVAAMAGLANAGDYGKAPVIDAKAPVDLGCACYGTGFEFSGFAAGILPDGGDDDFGGGASLGYFLTENLGVELSYSVLASDSEEHVITANAVYRFVNADACIAPYVLVGGGVLTNGSTDGVFDVGGGVDIRLEALGCVGIFADATYNWAQGDREDFTLIRAGFRVPF